MNANRRKELQKVIELIEQAKSQLEEHQEQEQEAIEILINTSMK